MYRTISIMSKKELTYGGINEESYPTTRPDVIPGQVLSPEEIVLGDRYVMMHKGKLTEAVLKALSLPVINPAYGSLAIKVEATYSSGSKKEHDISLADHAVVAYKNGVWNPSNRLLRYGVGSSEQS